MKATSEGQNGIFDHVPEYFWSRAAQAPHRILMLDYDGTLAPFRIQRQNAIPHPGVLDTLARIVAGGRTSVVVVSGRPLVELEAFIPLTGVALIGEHGFEERTAGGERVTVPMPEGSLAALDRAAHDAQALGFGDHIERKRSSVVLHTRGLAAEAAEKIEEAVRKIWRDAVARGQRLDRIHGGLELRATGRNKGSAVKGLIMRAPEGAFPVYLGDDETDEDAFVAVRAHGFGIKVGTTPSLARGHLDSCERVPEFLSHWLVRVEGVSQPVR